MARIISDDALVVITLWSETEGEDIIGKTMVAEVIYNRVLDPRWPDSPGQVVLQPAHFSEWNQNDPRSVRSLLLDDTDPIVQDCIRAWGAAQAGSTFAKGANHYHATHTTPYWAPKMTEVARHGGHIFYKG